MRNRVYIAGIVIFLLTFAVYSPALRYDTVSIDDDLYFIDNQHIRSFDGSLFAWAFTTFKAANWHPLTWLSLAADYALWGPNPGGFHLQSVVWHSLNVFLLVLLINKLFFLYSDGRSPQGLFSAQDQAFIVAVLGALAFGLHPLRVESVAWISERKDVLCAFFYLISLLFYLSYAAAQSVRRAGAWFFSSLAAFALSLLAKPMSVTLPVTFLILDALVLRRFEVNKPATYRRPLIEKIPFFLLSLASSIVTVAAQAQGGATRTLAEFSFPTRILNALYAVAFYLYKTIFPINLSPFYPYPSGISLLDADIIVSLLFFAGMTVFSLRAYKHGKSYWLAAWGHYLITLLPVIGIIQVGVQRAADRYTYLPSIGVAILLAAGLLAAAEKIAVYARSSLTAKGALITLGLPLALVLALATARQLPVWKDALAQTNRAVEVFPSGAARPYIDRGYVWLDLGKYDHAVDDCSYALSLEPDSPDALMCRAETEEKQGNYPGALSDYNRFLLRYPVHADALNKRGITYLKMGERLKAQADFDLSDLIGSEIARLGKSPAVTSPAVAAKPYADRGLAWLAAGETDKGFRECDRALELQPDCTRCLLCRAQAFEEAGQYANALADYTAVLQLDPADAAALGGRGALYLKLGDTARAQDDFRLRDVVAVQKP